MESINNKAFTEITPFSLLGLQVSLMITLKEGYPVMYEQYSRFLERLKYQGILVKFIDTSFKGVNDYSSN